MMISDLCRDILYDVLLLHDGVQKSITEITMGPSHGQLHSVLGTKGQKTLRK